MGTSTSDADRYAHWPDLQFHYGLSFTELRSMPRNVRGLYERALPRLLAERQAAAIDASAFPHLKPEAQRSITRKIERRLETGDYAPAEKVDTPAELEKRAAMAGIAITQVDGSELKAEPVGVPGRA